MAVLSRCELGTSDAVRSGLRKNSRTNKLVAVWCVMTDPLSTVDPDLRAAHHGPSVRDLSFREISGK
jgi:hypothetical protein